MKISLTDITNTIPVSWDDDKERDEFLESLREQGQLHAIIVRPLNNTGYEVVTGAKRYEAARLLGWAELDAEVKSPNDVEGKIMRVHENLHRHNLPWYEAVILVQQLHELRQEQHGKSVGVGRPKKDEKVWGVRETASELSLSVGGVSEDLHLARAVQIDPSLKNIKDRKTAIKLVRAAARRMQDETMAAMSDEDKAVQINEVYLGDSAEVLSHIPEYTFDVCITDPPWLNFFDPRLVVDKRTLPVFKELYRVLKPDALLFVIVSVDDFVYYGGYDYLDEKGNKTHRGGALERIGFKIAKTPIFWQKENSLSRRGVRTWEYDRDFETILVAAKGSPVLAKVGPLSAFKPFPQVPPVHMIHPNEKPVSLIVDLLNDCSYEGSFIVDPFGGSGVTAVACAKTNRRYVVIERDKQFYDGIVNRLANLKEKTA